MLQIGNQRPVLNPQITVRNPFDNSLREVICGNLLCAMSKHFAGTQMYGRSKTHKNASVPLQVYWSGVHKNGTYFSNSGLIAVEVSHKVQKNFLSSSIKDLGVKSLPFVYAASGTSLYTIFLCRHDFVGDFCPSIVCEFLKKEVKKVFHWSKYAVTVFNAYDQKTGGFVGLWLDSQLYVNPDCSSFEVPYKQSFKVRDVINFFDNILQWPRVKTKSELYDDMMKRYKVKRKQCDKAAKYDAYLYYTFQYIFSFGRPSDPQDIINDLSSSLNLKGKASLSLIITAVHEAYDQYPA